MTSTGQWALRVYLDHVHCSGSDNIGNVLPPSTIQLPETSETSILIEMEEVPKVLCLGVSYPCLKSTVERKGIGFDRQSGPIPSDAEFPTPATGPAQHNATRKYKTENKVGLSPKNGAVSEMMEHCNGRKRSYVEFRDSIDAVLDFVKHSCITAMDGRDLVRCLATENHCSVHVYTVSQEDGAVYDQRRHMWANFNRPSFVRSLQKKFHGVTFDQVILDYYWIPCGWDVTHWRSHLFEYTLVHLARYDVLRRPKEQQPIDKNNFHGKGSDRIKTGVVYLPFCFHCFKEVIAHIDCLREYYDISFLRKGDLEEITLWSGTQQIEAESMRKFSLFPC